MLLEIKDLKFHYSKAPKNACALSLNHFSLQQGERVFIRGRSGSGKSTLLNIVAGVLKAPPKSVYYRGKDFSQMKAAERDHIRAQEMGIVFQQFNLIPFLSAKENAFLPLQFRGRVATADDKTRSSQLFERLKLPAQVLEKPVRELSVGQQQRVAVVRALLQKPHLILADEPTSSLDFEVRESFIKLLLEETQAIGAAVLFVSHDSSLESFFERTLELSAAEGDFA